MVDKRVEKIAFAHIESVLAAGFCEGDEQILGSIISEGTSYVHPARNFPAATIYTAVELSGI